jgi:hypothetical protein
MIILQKVIFYEVRHKETQGKILIIFSHLMEGFTKRVARRSGSGRTRRWKMPDPDPFFVILPDCLCNFSTEEIEFTLTKETCLPTEEEKKLSLLISLNKGNMLANRRRKKTVTVDIP